MSDYFLFPSLSFTLSLPLSGLVERLRAGEGGRTGLAKLHSGHFVLICRLAHIYVYTYRLCV